MIGAVLNSLQLPNRFQKFLAKVAMTGPTLLILVLTTGTVGAQDRAADRRRFLDPDASVSDDPRRVPISLERWGSEGVVVLKGGRVFDGTGSPVREVTVVIDRNRITKLVSPKSSDWPDDARVFELGGKTVLPGLIDLHTHLSYVEPGVSTANANNESDATLRGLERLRYYIESGITSVRDVASHGSVPFRLKEWVRQRRIPGPRVFAVGRLIVGSGGHGDGGPSSGSSQGSSAVRVASGADDWREAVRENFKAGADAIKLASHFSREEVRAAVEEAHSLGLRVIVDAETFYIQWAVEAGADDIEHPLPRTDETIRLMAQRGTYAVPTLAPYIYIFDINGGYFGSTSRRFSFSKAANLAMLGRMKRAGVKLGIGTDLVSDWFRYLPGPYITELKQFVAAGFTISEALTAATKTNAEILDMADKLGTIEIGKLADVVVVDGRPDEQLDDLARVELVIRDGTVVIQSGHIAVPRHTARPEPEPRR